MFKSISLFGILLILSACGQNGALYLAEKTNKNKKTEDSGVFMKKPEVAIVPSFVPINTVSVVGRLAQINENNVPSWQAVLTRDSNDSNPLRYIVLQDNILQPTDSIAMLIGTVRNTDEKSLNDSERMTIRQGNYLRFRSLEAGASHIPQLIASARRYMSQATHVKPRSAPHFFIENQQAVDLYIAIERVK